MRILLISLLFCMGCAGLSVDSENLILTTTSRALGYHVAQEYPDLVKPALLLCDALSGANGTEATELIAYAMTYLSGYSDDPLLQATISDIMGSVTIEGEVDLKRLEIVIVAFKSGLVL